MKKFLLVLPAILLVGAGCSSSTSTGYKQTPPATPPVSRAAQVDALATGLSQSVSAEEQTTIESDTDVITSDREIILNGSEDVSNASQN